MTGAEGASSGAPLDWFRVTFEGFLIIICVITIALNAALILAICKQSNFRISNYSYLIGLNLSIINFLVGVCGKSQS